jgi:hypothetical protein
MNAHGMTVSDALAVMRVVQHRVTLDFECVNADCPGGGHHVWEVTATRNASGDIKFPDDWPGCPVCGEPGESR